MNTLEIPFNRHLGLQRSDRDGCLLMLPDDPRYTNHLGTVHAGALLALAENSSGELMLRELAGAVGADVVPVVRRVEAKFSKPIRGAAHGRATLDPAAREAFLATFARKGRALVTVHVDLLDAEDVRAATVQVEWFVARA